MVACSHNLSLFPHHAPAVVISEVSPLVEGGRYPLKRLVFEPLRIEADIFRDGQDPLQAELRWRAQGEIAWQKMPLVEGENQRWSAEVSFEQAGLYEVHIAAWPDVEAAWRRGFGLKVEAGVDVSLEIEEGARLIEAAALRARQERVSMVANQLEQGAKLLRRLEPEQVMEFWDDEAFSLLRETYQDRRLETLTPEPMPILVERKKASFSAWYEFFPRNAVLDGKTHARFRDCLPMLEHAEKMGFDTIYLPPVHPIGRVNRKGKNNSLQALEGDIGSPWAIGAQEGGHEAILPELGELEDFRWLVAEANKRGLEIAMDFAMQCAPDHPWVKENPHWFVVRSDGSIQYAENPPKRYEDIYPFDFHCADWRNLWKSLADVLLFWCERGVRAFRVDNPHTKPVAFWEYALHRVRQKYPEVIFLSEAFTKPKMMAMLGKIGFSQSYSYFTWRTSKQELIDYVQELIQPQLANVMRANFWPNTPDILAYELWNAPLEKFKIRAMLAAMLSSNWGLYQGYEWAENEPFPPKEEYANSEKYQLVSRDLGATGQVAWITRLNEIRRAWGACSEYRNVEFCPSENEQVLAWCRWDSFGGHKLICVCNLDAFGAQQDWVDISVLGLAAGERVRMRDLLDGSEYEWVGGQRAFVGLSPQERVGHVFARVEDCE